MNASARTDERVDARSRRGRFVRRLALVLAVGALGTSVAAISQASGSPQANVAAKSGWCSGVNLRFFAGGAPGDAFSSIVVRGAQRAQADLGPKVTYIFSSWDFGKMVSQLRDAVAARPDGIAMMGHPKDAAIMPLARQAAAAGILMEYQNIDVTNVRARYGGGFVGPDNTSQGRQLGQAALKMFKLKRGDRAVVTGGWDVPVLNYRSAAVANALAAGGLKVVKLNVSGTDAGDPNLLTPRLSAVLLKFPDTKLIVLSGGQILGAAPQYMRAVNKRPGQIKIVGFDLSEQVVQAFENRYVQMTMDQQPFLQGYLPILSLCGQKVYRLTPLSFDTGIGIVTAKDIPVIKSLISRGVR